MLYRKCWVNKVNSRSSKRQNVPTKILEPQVSCSVLKDGHLFFVMAKAADVTIDFYVIDWDLKLAHKVSVRLSAVLCCVWCELNTAVDSRGQLISNKTLDLSAKSYTATSIQGLFDRSRNFHIKVFFKEFHRNFFLDHTFHNCAKENASRVVKKIEMNLLDDCTTRLIHHNDSGLVIKRASGSWLWLLPKLSGPYS